jgi:hypothetical protein
LTILKIKTLINEGYLIIGGGGTNPLLALSVRDFGVMNSK